MARTDRPITDAPLTAAAVAESWMISFMERWSALFLAVRDVVNRQDPVGLVDRGAPDDEYDPEVEDLLKLRGTVTAGQVADVFMHWFGESGTMSSNMAARIADGINHARARNAEGSWPE